MNLNSHQLNAYSRMLQIRSSENLIAEDYLKNKIFSFLHLSVGQEASAVGVCFNLDHDDIVLGNHRSHGHYLAKGGDLKKMFYEVYGHPLGCCRGIGGSMHMLDRSVNFMGSTPILGSLAPIGAGFAFKQKELGSKNIALSFIGDGSAEEGSFYESLNLAAKFNLPYIIVIEDNKYSVNSLHSDRKSMQYSHEKVVEGLGCRYLRTSGQDYEKVSTEVLKAKKIALSGVPVVLHLDVLRDYAHSGPIRDDAAHYRGDDTADHRKINCPISIYRSYLIKNNQATEDQLAKIDADIQASCSAIFNEVRAVVKREIGI